MLRVVVVDLLDLAQLGDLGEVQPDATDLEEPLRHDIEVPRGRIFPEQNRVDIVCLRIVVLLVSGLGLHEERVLADVAFLVFLGDLFKRFLGLSKLLVFVDVSCGDVLVCSGERLE